MSQSQETYRGELSVELPYLLGLPESYDMDPNEQWPLMVFLHGAGERGDDLSKVKKHGPPKLLAAGQPLPAIVVSPQCPAGHWWYANELMTMIDGLISQYRVDASRVYITGLSMGGFGTFALCAYAPDRFAAAVPICGGGETLHAAKMAKVPMRVYHGRNDPVVPVGRSETMVEAIRAAGGDVELTIYPDAMHDSWTATYDDSRVFEWMLKQRKE